MFVATAIGFCQCSRFFPSNETSPYGRPNILPWKVSFSLNHIYLEKCLYIRTVASWSFCVHVPLQDLYFQGYIPWSVFFYPGPVFSRLCSVVCFFFIQDLYFQDYIPWSVFFYPGPVFSRLYSVLCFFLSRTCIFKVIFRGLFFLSMTFIFKVIFRGLLCV